MASEPSEEALEPGSVFAGYEVVRPLGAGEFGAVYEAVKPGAARRVALKVLKIDKRGNEEIVARFLREARAVALLKHPGIVAAVEVGDFEGQPFLAMELLVGETLTNLIKRERQLPLGRALDVAIPLMAAVRTVHAQGIVHRDLKPDNVFITTNDEGVVRPKVLDFGVAKMAEPGLQLTGKDTAIGTPNFMSPEQMLSPRGVDPRSDQWALGVLLYYMLTGVKPFAAKALADTLRNVLNVDPPPVHELAPGVPGAVSQAIARAMRKPPDKRFGSVHEFAQALLPFASDVTALLYASEFYTVAVWEQLGEPPPARESEVYTPAPRRRRAGASTPSNPVYPTNPTGQAAAGRAPATTPNRPQTRPTATTPNRPSLTTSRPSLTTSRPSLASSPALTSPRPTKRADPAPPVPPSRDDAARDREADRRSGEAIVPRLPTGVVVAVLLALIAAVVVVLRLALA